MPDKRPAFLFYPSDWLRDTRTISPSARALWIDMLCLMHDSGRRGYLQQPSGKPYTHESLARLTGFSSAEVSQLLQELTDSGVLSCTAHGEIYSRRMVRDESKRVKCSEAGRKGVTLRGTSKVTSRVTLKGQSQGGGQGPPQGQGQGPPENEIDTEACYFLIPPNGASSPKTVLNTEGVSCWFERVFWQKYPRKVGKDQARKWVERNVRSASTEATIDEGLTVWLQEFSTRQPEHIPYPATFLNSGAWKPDSRPATPTPRTNGLHVPRSPAMESRARAAVRFAQIVEGAADEGQ